MKRKIWNQKKKKEFLSAIILFCLILIFLFFLEEKLSFLQNRESFENFIEGFGVWGPLVIIFVIMAEVVFAPLPGFLPVLSAGFLFGPIEGGIYAFIGNVGGTLIAFFLARKFGKKFIQRFTQKSTLEKYEKKIEEHENLFLLVYFIPFVPLDIVSFAFGLSGVRYRKFIPFICAGYLFYVLIFSFFGDYLAKTYF
ncbi:TVP38/TMEM64 family protein [Candidatus Gracilibacteria bacterium]|nr:TVP38/TMEM64 family protein [Candidatus Gracilibacteria bacterium]MCF7819395.1 TVP38/TMEM64 family protein [Candidatus Gracilibacteria bacterium]